MSVLVTGAGLIGTLTASSLAARGEVVVIADLHEPAGDRLAGVFAVACDVTDAAALDDVVASHGVTRIVHTAAILSTGIRQDPLRGIAVNVMGTATVLEVARRHALQRVVIASSTTVGYAAFARHGAAAIEEDLPLHMLSERPASLYTMSKVAGEQMALLYRDLYGLDVVILRYGAVLGTDLNAPTSVPGRLLAYLAQAGRSGEPIVVDDPFLLWGGTEEFVDARDCARANLCALDASGPSQRVYNVAPGEAHSMASFVEAAERAFPGLKIVLPPLPTTGFAGFPHVRPAPSATEAARRELGFACRHDLEDSLAHWGAMR